VTRVVSLVPSVTDTLAELGAGPLLVGISADCDRPDGRDEVAVVTRQVVPAALTAAAPSEVDATVRSLLAAGDDLYDVDVDLVASLRPDVVFGQDGCRVCAVPASGLAAALAERGVQVEVVSVDPESLDDVAASFEAVGRAVGLASAGRALRSRFQGALRGLEGEVGFSAARGPAPRVLVLDWLDPPFVAGHWVPELVNLAGGEPALGEARRPSREVSPEELASCGADAVVVALCGLDLEDSVAAARQSGLLASVAPGRALVLDGRLLFSRPGPRLVSGAEALAWWLSGRSVPSRFDALARVVELS
jgi:iron complex transport system substrate-binding protein